ncbi:MAG: hypothetical protein ABL888_00165 [Pirellulaceae bacterium]
MRSTLFCSALCLVALLASGCCVNVSRSGDCGPDRCSTGFQNRIFGGGLFRGAGQNCGCDGGAVGGCGTNGGVSNGCGANGGIMNGCGANGRLLNGCGANGNISDGCGCNGGVSNGCGCNSGGRGCASLGGANGGCGCGDCGGSGAGLAGGGIGGGLNLPGLGGGMGGGMGDGAFGGGMGDGGVALAGFSGGCGRFGCGTNGRYCLGCRLKNLSSGGRGGSGSGSGLLHKMVPNGMAGNHPYGGQLPHTEPIPTNGGPDSTAPTYQYPYYTLRGPRDFLQSNPPSIGY